MAISYYRYVATVDTMSVKPPDTHFNHSAGRESEQQVTLCYRSSFRLELSAIHQSRLLQ